MPAETAAPASRQVGGRPHPADFAQRRLRRAADRLGRGDRGERGPVVGTTATRAHRNVIGTHCGSYSVYRALAVAAGALSRAAPRPTSPTPRRPTSIGPYPQWSEPRRIVSLDPWGASVAEVFAAELAAGYDIRPTIAVTKAHVILPEVDRGDPAAAGWCADGTRPARPAARRMVTKAAIEPVWWLPGVAAALRLQRDRPAPRAVRGDRRHVPRARHAHATSRCSCRRSAGRPSTSSATRATSPIRRSS